MRDYRHDGAHHAHGPRTAKRRTAFWARAGLAVASLLATAAATSLQLGAPAGGTDRPVGRVGTQDTAAVRVARRGSHPVQPGRAAQFTGAVQVTSLFDTTDATRAAGASVAFAPGARTAWHTHPRGQVLIVTAGVGRVQRWGGPVDEIRPGDVVRIPPGAKHWHGASPEAAMTHLAIQEARDGWMVEWLEPVSETQYRAAPRASR